MSTTLPYVKTESQYGSGTYCLDCDWYTRGVAQDKTATKPITPCLGCGSTNLEIRRFNPDAQLVPGEFAGEIGFKEESGWQREERERRERIAECQREIASTHSMLDGLLSRPNTEGTAQVVALSGILSALERIGLLAEAGYFQGGGA